MPLESATLYAGTTNSCTGGTEFTLTPDGVTVANGLHLINAAVTDFRIRPTVTVKNKQPTLDGLGVYGKDRKTITLVEPQILASGKTVFNLIRIEREVHPELSAASAKDLLDKASQMCYDTDFAQFWASGSLA